METERKNFRKEHIELRNAMTEEQAERKSMQITKYLLSSAWYAKAPQIFAYYPLGKEVDTRFFIRQAWKDGKRIALPRTGKQYEMRFYYIDSFTQLKEGAFHVAEPEEGCGEAYYENQPVLVPGTVFDRQGVRYGYGKGYYDRFFSEYPKLKRYAVCYDHQMEPVLPAKRHDVPMHRIYTESGCFKMI